MLELLQKRFEQHMERHMDVKWNTVEERLLQNKEALIILQKMEESGGEPDVTGIDSKTGMIIFCDCSKETPAGRRSLCYDKAARINRKKNPSESSAEEQAESIGISLLDEEMYRRLQTLGEFDLKTSSWIRTPDEIRRKGGAIFCERRYGAVFTFHNSADSYYSVRGWRGYIQV